MSEDSMYSMMSRSVFFAQATPAAPVSSVTPPVSMAEMPTPVRFEVHAPMSFSKTNSFGSPDGYNLTLKTWLVPVRARKVPVLRAWIRCSPSASTAFTSNSCSLNHITSFFWMVVKSGLGVWK